MSDLSLVAGVTASVTFNMTQGADVYSLVGAQAIAFTVKTNKADTEALLSKTLGDGIAITDAANGVAVLTLDPADTVSLAEGAYFFDLLVKDSSDQVFSLNSGRFVVTARVGAITSATVRKMVVGADSLNNWLDAVTLSLVAGIDVSDTLNLWRDSVTLAQFDTIIAEDTNSGNWADSLAIGIGLAVGDTLSMSDAATVVMA